MTRSRTGWAALAAAVCLTASCGQVKAGDAGPGYAVTSAAPALASTGCTAPDAAFAALGSNGVLVSDGEERAFRIDVPGGRTDIARPVVVNLHGARVPRDTHESITGVARLGVEQGLIVATPQAQGAHPIWRIADQATDLAFVERLVSEIQTRLCVDESRVYLMGFSMGGMLSMALACQHPERYAAIAVVAGTVQLPECERDSPVPLLAFHGTADALVRFDGSNDESLYFLIPSIVDPPRAETVNGWAHVNGCDSEREIRRIPPDVDHHTFACGPGQTVELYVTDGGGHTWPGATPGPFAPSAEDVSRTIDATALILSFFQRHQRVG